MPLSSSTSALARRASRCAAEPSRANSIRSRRDSLSRKPGWIMDEAESHYGRLTRGFSGFPQSRGILRHRWQQSTTALVRPTGREDLEEVAFAEGAPRECPVGPPHGAA